jgi:transcriptional regulator with XRE-family HTH domain
VAGSPSIRRRRLAAELRRLRADAELSIEEVAEPIGWQPSKLSRIENRQVGITTRDLRKLLDIYKLDDNDHRAELLEMARRATERGWWQSYNKAIVPSAYATLIGLEDEAATIRNYEPEVVPGLLQIPDYTRAIFRASLPTATADEIERRVEVRLERQEILTRSDPPPPQVNVVLNEAVLARRVGDSDVMRRQIESLSQERDRGNVVIQILPFSAGGHPAMAGSFVLMTFLDPTDTPALHVENIAGGLNLERPEDIRNAEEIWTAIQQKAVSPSDSRAVMRTYSLR